MSRCHGAETRFGFSDTDLPLGVRFASGLVSRGDTNARELMYSTLTLRVTPIE